MASVKAFGCLACVCACEARHAQVFRWLRPAFFWRICKPVCFHAHLLECFPSGLEPMRACSTHVKKSPMTCQASRLKQTQLTQPPLEIQGQQAHAHRKGVLVEKSGLEMHV